MAAMNVFKKSFCVWLVLFLICKLEKNCPYILRFIYVIDVYYTINAIRCQWISSF